MDWSVRYTDTDFTGGWLMEIKGAAGSGIARNWLIFPPFADPTWPYVSLPTLKGYLAARGIPSTVLDLNAGCVDFLAAPETAARLRTTVLSRFSRLDARRQLTRAEQMEYLRLLDALECFPDVATAAAILRDPERLTDPAACRVARDAFEDLFVVLEAACFPFSFSFNKAAHLIAPWDFDALEAYIGSGASPVAPYTRERLLRLAQAGGPPRVVGLSLTFVSQIPETFRLCREVRELFPEAFIVLGGPCLGQITRHGNPDVSSRLLDFADALCPGEGEKPLELLLNLLAGEDGHPGPERLAQIPNLITRDPAGGPPRHGPAWVWSPEDAVAPDYSDLDLGAYLAPSPMLLYSPTRGCYWNRCSFCAYGFNQDGAHTYREVPVDRAVADLRRLHEQTGAKHFYFSCDVIAPKYAFALAEALLADGLEIRWSTDLRLEAAYTPERCALLYQSGLRAVAFGVESGSPKTLKCMDKGTTPERIRTVNRAFHEAGIATAWMTFTGHPGETFSQAEATLALLEAERDRVDQFIVGTFDLTPGSRIHAAPADFGVDQLTYTRGDVFGLFPIWSDRAARARSPEQLHELGVRVDRLAAGYRLDHYPWAGAISTHHSFLHLLRHGQRAFAQPRLRRRDALPPLRDPAAPPPPRPRQDPDRLAEQVDRFLGRYLERALTPDPQTGLAPLSFSHFMQALK
ncbi:radical SAM protein [Myxococcota bacterium]|nr:radical SAM protein [Myxococcota bacterium]